MTVPFDEQVFVDGSVDETQLRVQGHSTQNQPLQTWEDSTGDALATMTGDGRLQLGDDLGLASPDALIEVHRDEESTTRPKRGFHALGQVRDALENAAQWIVHELEIHGTENLSTLQTALRVRAANMNTGTPTASAELRAADIEVINDAAAGSAALPEATGLHVAVTNAAGKSLTRAVGLHVKMNNEGTITSPYAVFTEGEGAAHFDDYLEVKRPSAVPGTPASDHLRIYPKSDGKLLSKDWSGVEYDLTSANVNVLSEDVTPDETTAYFAEYDTSASTHKKVLLAKLRAARTRSDDVAASPTDMDFRRAFGVVPNGFHAALKDAGVGTVYWVTYFDGSPIGKWNYVATSEATYAVFEDYISDLPNLVAYWPCDDTSGIYGRVINPAKAEGRNILLDGNMEEAGTTRYIATGAPAPTLSKEGSAHGGSYCLRVASSSVGSFSAQQAILTTGLIYHVHGWARGDGTNVPRIASSTVLWTGTNSTSWQEFDIYSVGFTTAVQLNGNFTASGYVEFDDVSVKMVGIKPSTDYPMLELAKNGGFDWDAGWTKGAGWTIAGGVAHASAAAAGISIAQNAPIDFGRTYSTSITVSNSSGSFRVALGSTGLGTTRTGDGTYNEDIVCGGDVVLRITPVGGAFTGDVEIISVVPTDGLLVWNGDGSTTTGWDAQNSATLSSVSGWLRVAYNGVANAGATQTQLKLGSTYHLTLKMRSDGTAIPSVIVNSTLVTGTNSVSDQPVDIVFVAAAINLILRNTTSSGYVAFDDIVIEEIAPMSSKLFGLTLNQNSGVALADPVDLADGVNDYGSLYSTEFNSAVNPDLFNIGVYFKSDAWPGSGSRYLVSLVSISGTNEYSIYQSSTGLIFSSIRGSTIKYYAHSMSDTDPHYAAMEVDAANNRIRCYLDGVMVGELTGIGTWTGNFANGFTVMAARSSSVSFYDGYIGDIPIENAVPGEAEQLARAQLIGVI